MKSTTIFELNLLSRLSVDSCKLSDSGEPNYANLAAYRKCVNQKQAIIAESIDIYLSTGKERLGVSGRSSIRSCLPMAAPLKSGGSSAATVAEPFHSSIVLYCC